MPSPGLASSNMTPEQNEAWQRAVMRAYPAPTPDGQECTLEQWQEHRRAESAVLPLLPWPESIRFLESRVKTSAEHLRDWQLPDWVLDIRDRWAFESISHQGATFTLRCDTALIGMQLRYPTRDAKADAYQRLLIGYLSRALRPLIEQTEASNDTELRHDFEGYHQICLLCESDGLYWDQERWLEIRTNFASGSSRRHLTNKSRAKRLVEAFVILAQRVLFQIEEPVDEDGPRNPMSTSTLMFYLPWEYLMAELYRHFMGQAFLTALESECPPPDWLPRI